MKRFFSQFRYGQKGFTLIELLVVVAILGVLAAVAVPNVGKFIGKGKQEAAETELANVLTAVTAGMADAITNSIEGGGAPNDNPTDGNFGNTEEETTKPYSVSDDIVVSVSANVSVGDYISGGVENVAGSYYIDTTGKVTQVWYAN